MICITCKRPASEHVGFKCPDDSDLSDDIDMLSRILVSTEYMMRGMLLDPLIPESAKEAMQNKIKEIESIYSDYA